MAMLVVLVTGGSPDLGPAATSQLAALGVSGVSLVRDADTVGIVLEGWAFEPDASAGAALAALAVDCADVRLLRPLAEMAVRTAPTTENMR